MIGGEMKESGKDVFSFQEKAKNNQEEKVDPNPFIITVFLSTLLGLVILIIKDKNQYKISFYARLVGLASLITFIINIKNKINDPITIEFDFAFWLTMICLLIAIILSYLEGFKPINRSGKNFFL